MSKREWKKYQRDDERTMDSPVASVMPSGAPALYPRVPFTPEAHEPPEPEVRIGHDRFRVTRDGVVVYYDDFSHTWKVSIYQRGIVAPLARLLNAAHEREQARRSSPLNAALNDRLDQSHGSE